MYRIWCEGGGDRAWWVIESVILRSPDKGFWACLGDIPPDMPRRPKTWVSLCNLMLKLCDISRSSAILGLDSPQSNNRKDHSLWVTPFIPRERPNVKHAIAGYLRLPRPTSAPALMRVLHWLRCWAEEPGYTTGNPPQDYGQLRGGCSCNLMLKLCDISRSSAILGLDSPQSNNRKDHSLWVTPFIPRERPNVKHAIAGYLRLPRPTLAPALMRVLHWLRCWAEEPGYTTGNPPQDYGQLRGGCSCPWMIAVD